VQYYLLDAGVENVGTLVIPAIFRLASRGTFHWRMIASFFVVRRISTFCDVISTRENHKKH
jgi:hypothetical protein